MAYNAELQMLRELVWFLAPQLRCHFCNRPLVPIQPNMTFGHRRHRRFDHRLTLHHEDENRANNSFDNVKLAHTVCHLMHHNGIDPTTEKPYAKTYGTKAPLDSETQTPKG